MSFEKRMLTGARDNFTAIGDFLFVEKAAGELLITTQSGGYYVLTQGAQVKSERLAGVVTVENRGVEGDVKLKVGFGEYVPPQRDTVAVSALPAVEVSALPAVQVSSLPAVELAANQTVRVSSLPEMQLAAGQSLDVSSIPEMTIAAGQSVGVSSLPAVELKKSASLAAGVHAMPYTIPANAGRKKITIKALSGNTAAVTVAGAYPLEAGEKLELETTAEIQLTGDAANSIAVLEI
ncbi:TPA: hypothetical protein RQK49_002032 [Vibrio vulnificus]|uniref:hypothetical protein n=1 Tax=Vibrio vulnificus TaxID=672 RepID=UPI001A1B3CBB|nr:hypothetical protein [Vibrio vulnificus]MCJ0813265.1 hypothetical protein [Vibrio vulnificus]HAS6217102.1 hypothetical protein [Vibrio vulnificus]HDY7922103.1 hypothetical protein [Vibrio vulnificus]HDY7931389.1 hypothetical protein [Vibrio vulnificus]